MKGRKLLAAILTLAMLLSAMPMTAWAEETITPDYTWYSPNETEFEISDAADLLGLADIANGKAEDIEKTDFEGKKIILKKKIDLRGESWTPIGSFKGEFDGKGYTIKNFNISTETGARWGFFNVLEKDSNVHDLVLADVTATVGNGRFGTLARSIEGVAKNITVKNVEVTTTHKDSYVGGMSYWVEETAEVKDCCVENLVIQAEKGARLIGGFACSIENEKNSFEKLYVKGFTATVTGTDESCGVAGFVAQPHLLKQKPSIINCHVSDVDITAVGTVEVGGFIAYPEVSTTVKNCTTEGKIDIQGLTIGYAGGFFADLGWKDNDGNGGHQIEDCTADVDIFTKSAPAGGFIGSATNENNKNMPAAFTNCTAKGNIIATGSASIGGFAGDADRGVYKNCKAIGVVSNLGDGYAGGFIGEIKNEVSFTVTGSEVDNTVLGTVGKTGKMYGNKSDTEQNTVDSTVIIVEKDILTAEKGKVIIPVNTTITVDGKEVALPYGGEISKSGDVIIYKKEDSDTKRSTKTVKYKITLADMENGTVESSHSKMKKNGKVTLTVLSAEGYVLDNLKVIAKNGADVDVTDNGDGTYTFKMPRSNVTVEADFSKMTEKESAKEQQEIRLTIGEKIAWVFDKYVVNDTAPEMRNGRTMLPIRFVVEALGGTVTWNADTQTVSIVKGDTQIEIYIGQSFALVNGNPMELEAPAYIVNGRTYLPLRFVAENLGATVTWNDATKTITIIG